MDSIYIRTRFLDIIAIRNFCVVRSVKILVYEVVLGSGIPAIHLLVTYAIFLLLITFVNFIDLLEGSIYLIWLLELTNVRGVSVKKV